MRTYHIKFCERKKIFFGISLAIIAIGIIFNFIFGTSLDISLLAAQSSVIPILVVSSREKWKHVKDASGKDVTVRIHEDMSTVDDPTQANNSVSISFAGTDSISLEEQQSIASALDEQYPDALLRWWSPVRSIRQWARISF